MILRKINDKHKYCTDNSILPTPADRGSCSKLEPAIGSTPHQHASNHRTNSTECLRNKTSAPQTKPSPLRRAWPRASWLSTPPQNIEKTVTAPAAETLTHCQGCWPYCSASPEPGGQISTSLSAPLKAGANRLLCPPSTPNSSSELTPAGLP